MSLDARQIAIAAGAEGALIDRIAERMVQKGSIGLEQAQALLGDLEGLHPEGES